MVIKEFTCGTFSPKAAPSICNNHEKSAQGMWSLCASRDPVFVQSMSPCPSCALWLVMSTAYAGTPLVPHMSPVSPTPSFSLPRGQRDIPGTPLVPLYLSIIKERIENGGQGDRVCTRIRCDQDTPPPVLVRFPGKLLLFHNKDLPAGEHTYPGALSLLLPFRPFSGDAS